mmetsp:Transcript_3696/g.5329  ORF Transcript_3696/g.5329 Transcript_3696/m.5329 type:complete len:109 (+) Transcript_3696:138-464(+)
MGGHSAWRKRLKAGLLAKQSGGAICRHRPHFGAQGIIINNKKGNIGGGNPKKNKNMKQKKDETIESQVPEKSSIGTKAQSLLPLYAECGACLVILIYAFFKSMKILEI